MAVVKHTSVTQLFSFILNRNMAVMRWKGLLEVRLGQIKREADQERYQSKGLKLELLMLLARIKRKDLELNLSSELIKTSNNLGANWRRI